MRGASTVIGLAATAIVATLATAPAQAGCTRAIINKSGLVAKVSRDGGPWVSVPPHHRQSIRLMQPGSVDVALSCPDGTPVWQKSFAYTAIIDRCYFEFDDGFVPDQFGGGTFGFRNTKPLTLNNPRQGDLIIGPRLEASCPSAAALRARY